MRSLAALVASGTLIAAACAQPITYQGVLSDNGVPANAEYDLSFKLLDAPTGGTLVGTPVDLVAVPVADGRFTVQLDFGPGAWSDTTMTRFLQISVGVSGSPAEPFDITPRHPITPAPLAVSALHHPIELADFGSGPTLTNPDAGARLLLNRATPISPGDFFGLEVPATVPGFGGMVVNHADPFGFPYFAYASGGLVGAFTWHEPSTDTWRVHNGTDQLKIDSLGNVEASTRFVAPEYTYDEAQTRTLSIPAPAWRAFDPKSWTSTNFEARGNTSSKNSAATPLYLPDGATVQNVILHFMDDVSAWDIRLIIYGHRHENQTNPTLLDLTTSGSSSFHREVDAFGRGFVPFTIDNGEFAYSMRLTLTDPNNSYWLPQLYVTTVKVIYAVPGPD